MAILSYLSEINLIILSQETMKTKVFSLFIALSVTALLFSCGKSAQGDADNGKPAVTVKTQHMSDTSGFTMSNGEYQASLASSPKKTN